MTQAPGALTHLVRAVLGRGEAVTETADGGRQSLLPPLGSPAVPGDPDLAASDLPDAPSPAAPDHGIVNVLAEKILLAWLRNRYQLLFPFAFDLHRLDEDQAELLVQAMVAAARADGAFDDKERERIEEALSRIGPGETAKVFLAAALDRPKPLHEILGRTPDVQTRARVYAVSLMAVDQRNAVNRCYLRYLAARLQLSEELVASLEQRFRSAG